MRYAETARAVVLIALVALGGCDNGESPTTPDPAPTVTETFSGTLTQNGAITHTFRTVAAGPVTTTLTAIEPSSSPLIGLSMGSWNGIICTANVANDLATTSAVLSGTVIGPSDLCVRIYDSQGAIPTNAPISYTVQVVHP